MKRLALMAATLVISAGVAQAQQRSNPFADFDQRMRQDRAEMERQAQQTKAAQRPTKAEPMAQSLADLLNRRWTIVGSAMMGSMLVLHSPSGGIPSWAMCEVAVKDGLGSLLPQPTSLCLALNNGADEQSGFFSGPRLPETGHRSFK